MIELDEIKYDMKIKIKIIKAILQILKKYLESAENMIIYAKNCIRQIKVFSINYSKEYEKIINSSILMGKFVNKTPNEIVHAINSRVNDLII